MEIWDMLLTQKGSTLIGKTLSPWLAGFSLPDGEGAARDAAN